MLPFTEGRGMNTEFVPCMGCPQGCVPRVLPQVCWQWDLLGSFGRGYLCLGEVVPAPLQAKLENKIRRKAQGTAGDGQAPGAALWSERKASKSQVMG